MGWLEDSLILILNPDTKVIYRHFQVSFHLSHLLHKTVLTFVLGQSKDELTKDEMKHSQKTFLNDSNKNSADFEASISSFSFSPYLLLCCHQKYWGGEEKSLSFSGFSFKMSK